MDFFFCDGGERAVAGAEDRVGGEGEDLGAQAGEGLGPCDLSPVPTRGPLRVIGLTKTRQN